MYKKYSAVVQLFPDYEEKISFLLQTDENFRELCSDYLLCVSMILVRKKEIDKNRAEIAEFEDLQKAMKVEILREIQKTNIFN